MIFPVNGSAARPGQMMTMEIWIVRTPPTGSIAAVFQAKPLVPTGQ